MLLRLPAALAIVVLLPGCRGREDDMEPPPDDTCSPCMTCSDTEQGTPCGCYALYVFESTCPLDCQCTAYCVDSNENPCNGQPTCAGSNGSCPDGCHEQGASCGLG